MNQEKIAFEPDAFLRVTAMDEAGARRFVTTWLKVPGKKIEKIVDAGPASNERYKEGARTFHVYTVKE